MIFLFVLIVISESVSSSFFVGNISITAPPVLFSSSRFLNSAGPTISEPGTGYNSSHT